MRYTQFEDLPVWQLAVSLYERSRALGLKAATGEAVMQDEFERVALGISTEIAQSFERSEKCAVLGHVENASALTAGLRSMIRILQQRENSPETTLQLLELRDGTVSCSRQLHAWSEVIRRSGLEEEPEHPVRSPERLKKLLENLPSSHSLRSDPVP